MYYRTIARRSLFVMMIVSLMLVFTSAVAAQEQPLSSLTFSEVAINELLQANNQNPENNLSVDLQQGQFVIKLEATGANGKVNTFTLTIVPSIFDQQLKLDATKLTLNDIEIPLNNNNPAIDSTTDSVDDFLSGQTGGGQIQNVTVTDDRLVIQWLNNDPLAPTITIRDTLLTLMFTESTINQMDWVTNPTGQYVSDVSVDLQPEVAVINVTRTIDPTQVAYEIRPTMVNEYVAWQVSAQADLQASLVHTLETIWHAYFGGVMGEGSMINAVVTDDTIAFTWDLANEGQETDPIVTYTVTEAEVNEALKAFTNEQLSNLFVDMTPDDLTVTASGLGENGTPYALSAVLVPTLADGQVTWEVTSITFNSTTIDPSQFDSGNGVTDAVTRGLNGNRRNNGTVTDFTMTDTDMSMTVVYR